LTRTKSSSKLNSPSVLLINFSVAGEMSASG
jgi:hypothetical protein